MLNLTQWRGQLASWLGTRPQQHMQGVCMPPQPKRTQQNGDQRDLGRWRPRIGGGPLRQPSQGALKHMVCTPERLRPTVFSRPGSNNQKLRVCQEQEAYNW